MRASTSAFDTGAVTALITPRDVGATTPNPVIAIDVARTTENPASELDDAERPSRRGWVAIAIGAPMLAVIALVATYSAPTERTTVPTRASGTLPTVATPIETSAIETLAVRAQPAAPTAPALDPLAGAPASDVAIPSEPIPSDPTPREPTPSEPTTARGRRGAPQATAPPRTASRIAEPENGWVTLAVMGGWAEIYEGDRSLGQTPTRIQLRAGRHVLTVRPFGRGPDRRVSVTVAPNATTPLVVDIR